MIAAEQTVAQLVDAGVHRIYGLVGQVVGFATTGPDPGLVFHGSTPHFNNILFSKRMVFALSKRA